MLQQPLLSPQSTTIAGKAAIASYYTMTGNKVMWTKIVGDLNKELAYHGTVNLKGKQALLESNLPAIGLMLKR